MSHLGLLEAYDRAFGTDSTPTRFTGSPWDVQLSAHLPVADLAAGSVAAFAASIDRFCSARGLPTSPWELDPERIAASFSADRFLRIDGAPVNAFAPLSGFFGSADGWVRTHANYPHHRRALTAALELAPDVDRDVFARRVRSLPGSEIERRAAAGAAVAVRVRTELEWATGEGSRTAHGSVVNRTERLDSWNRTPGGATSSEKPLRGIKVLDLTRVIAGPTATRALALLGATVLRVDSPRMPEIEWQHLENGQGKSSALVDLTSADGRAAVGRLLAEADVVVTDYRPDSVNLLLPTPPPGTVQAHVSAWGRGPWQRRRGFDSIVQAATGISVIEGSREQPGVLPAQALDHASGYLLAAAVVDALALAGPGTRGMDVSVSLADTASWLLGAPGRDAAPAPPRPPAPARTTVTHGSVTYARPALSRYADYDYPAHPWGTDQPTLAPADPEPRS